MFGVAQRLGIPVTPIALRYEHADASWVGDDDFLPHYIATVGRPRTIAHLRYGEPLWSAPKERAEDFAARTRQVIRDLLSAS
jgi:1-acyl-sn-glycerol-3-phosphate acyltransferase